MGILRTLDQLEASLTEDLKWRIHELEQWQKIAEHAREHELPGLLRGGLALLYAHWEGYVKVAGRAYLEYVGRKGLKLGDLRHELAAVALRSMLGRGEMSKKSTDHIKIVEALRGEAGLPANLPYTSATIRTRANLNFETFADIMESIGCDAARHEIYRSTIDARLLRHRHEIVHGKEDYVTLQDWSDIKDRIVIIPHDVRSQISNEASQEGYRKDKITI